MSSQFMRLCVSFNLLYKYKEIIFINNYKYYEYYVFSINYYET